MNPLPSDSSEHHKAHGLNWLHWLGHLAGQPNVAGLEQGTWKGESAEWFLDHILTGEHATIHCVDTFEGSEEHKVAGIDCSNNLRETRARLERFGARAVLLQGMTVEILPRLLADEEKYDFIYVDGPHDSMNVLRDSVFSFELLKPGGVMIWDDYAWDVFPQPLDRPKMAVDAFIASYARRVEVLGLGWQVAVKKIA